MIQTVLSAYGLKKEETSVETFGTGLINNAWKLISSGKSYILQRVNEAVFKYPRNIAGNIRLMANYLHRHHPDYNFVTPVLSTKGDEIAFIKGEGFFRLFPFVTNSHSKEVVETLGQAYEPAVQFGRFTRLLSGIDLNNLKITIPSFHDLSLRAALKKGNKQRAEGYLDEMKDELTEPKKKYFFYAGKFVIYMQAVRFLQIILMMMYMIT